MEYLRGKHKSIEDVAIWDSFSSMFANREDLCEWWERMWDSYIPSGLAGIALGSIYLEQSEKMIDHEKSLFSAGL